MRVCVHACVLVCVNVHIGLCICTRLHASKIWQVDPQEVKPHTLAAYLVHSRSILIVDLCVLNPPELVALQYTEIDFP